MLIALRITFSISDISFSIDSFGTLVNHFGGRRSDDMPDVFLPFVSISSLVNSIGTSVIVAMPYLNGIRVLSCVV